MTRGVTPADPTATGHRGRVTHAHLPGEHVLRVLLSKLAETAIQLGEGGHPARAFHDVAIVVFVAVFSSWVPATRDRASFFRRVPQRRRLASSGAKRCSSCERTHRMARRAAWCTTCTGGGRCIRRRRVTRRTRSACLPRVPLRVGHRLVAVPVVHAVVVWVRAVVRSDGGRGHTWRHRGPCSDRPTTSLLASWLACFGSGGTPLLLQRRTRHGGGDTARHTRVLLIPLFRVNRWVIV